MLAALWAAEGALVPAAVQARIGGDLAYTTVMTILARLYEKGVIERERVGRAYAYRPVVAEAAVVADHVRRLLERGNSRTAVLQGLVDGLDPSDEQVLRDLLASAGRRRRGQA